MKRDGIVDHSGEIKDDVVTATNKETPMIACPHCGGNFTMEVKLVADVAKEQPAVPVMTPAKPPAKPTVQRKFAVHTDAGKLRHALWQAGMLPDGVAHLRVWNDKRANGRRLKMWWTRPFGFSTPQFTLQLKAIFSDRFRCGEVSDYTIKVYLNS